MKKLFTLLLFALCLLTGCHREPPLHLYWSEQPMVNIQMNVEIKALWDYGIYENWEDEWTYGWDETDEKVFGPIGYTIPEEYELRRYTLEEAYSGQHTRVDRFHLTESSLTTQFEFGYHDMLAWTAFPPMDHQNVIIDESSLDSVTAYTNMGMNTRYHTRSSNSMYSRNFNQPEDLFAGYRDSLYISSNFDDYDYYDEATHTYYLSAHMILYPVTYIYLTQIRLHNNRGRVSGTSGENELDGMARLVNLNNGFANDEVVCLDYYSRMKKDCVIKRTNEVVDVIGGKCNTFGIPEQNSARTTKENVNLSSRHYMTANLSFYTGTDSTFVFDVTDQVHQQWKGGILTIDIDVDTLHIPVRPGGSGMDAVIEDFEKREYEFEI